MYNIPIKYEQIMLKKLINRKQLVKTHKNTKKTRKHLCEIHNIKETWLKKNRYFAKITIDISVSCECYRDKG